MGLTQSAITLQIQSLERDLGVKLFERKNNKLNITPKGKIFYSYCISYVNDIENLFKNFSEEIKNNQSYSLDIASNHVGISYILPKYIKELKSLYPSIKLKIRNLPRQDCIQRLLNNEIDMFLYPKDINEVLDDFDFHSIVKYKPILLSHKNHPLSKKKKVTLGDISKYELVRIDPKFITLPAFEELLKAHKIKSNIEFEMSDWEILKKFVKANIGVAMISNIILEGEKEEDLVQTDLTEYFPAMDYGIFIKKRRNHNSLLKEFIDLLKNKKLLLANGD